MSLKLPEKINENFLIMSQNGFEVFELVKKYNGLSLNDSRRAIIYKQIEEKVSYEIHGD